MAMIAKRSARSLLAWVNAAVSGTNPDGSSRHGQVPWFHR